MSPTSYARRRGNIAVADEGFAKEKRRRNWRHPGLQWRAALAKFALHAKQPAPRQGCATVADLSLPVEQGFINNPFNSGARKQLRAARIDLVFLSVAVVPARAVQPVTSLCRERCCAFVTAPPRGSLDS
ncbi:hypothetical protein MRX96_013279 [Rhipicephalus microplus]